MVILYEADWMIPVSARPIRGGALAVQDDRIVAAGPSDKVRADYPDAICRSFGRAAILPGLVNVHSHLELTALRGYLEDPGFFAWLMKLGRARMRLTRDDLMASAMAGVCEAIRAGITSMGDIGDTSVGFQALKRSGQRGTFFQETICLHEAGHGRQFKKLRGEVDLLRAQSSDLLRVGVSPHAPYTVVASLFRDVTEFARAESLPMCIHTAESDAEKSFIMAGEGEFAILFRTLGARWTPPATSSVKYLLGLSALSASPLLVHCVNVDDEDVAMIADSGSRVAHCPKSNAKLSHGVAPLSKLRRAGITVGLGTDSVASNNRYDLIDEARFCALIHRATDRAGSCANAEDILTMATLGGAKALGLGDKIGTLEVGKDADFIAVSFDNLHARPVYDPVATLLFSCCGKDVIFAAVAGRALYDGQRVTSIDEVEVSERLLKATRRIGGF
jgi:cytosine/adenosine deaminase-related metal-dependent hydrolase